MCDICEKRVDKYWVVFKDGRKCCDYLCSRKTPFDIREVVNIEDFSEPRPVLPNKKEKIFIFKTEIELLNLTGDQLIEYYSQLENYRSYNPENFYEEQNSFEEDNKIIEMEREFMESSTDEDDGLFVDENYIY